MKIINQVKRYEGFTLIEVLISIGLFALLALLVTSTFFFVTNLQRNIGARQQILNDFRLSLDVMSKEMTSGSAFPSDCENGCSSMIFVTKPRPDMPQRNIAYRLGTTTGAIEKGEQKDYGLCSTLPLDNNCYQPITSPDIKVSSLTFFVSNKGDFTQPIITIQAKGTIYPGGRQEQPFNITSSITPRQLQNPDAIPPSENEPPTIEITEVDGQARVGDTFTVDKAVVSLAGIASDNDQVVDVRWTNETSGQSGIVSGSLTNWSIDSISLIPSTANIIDVEALDPSGNPNTDTVTINAGAAGAEVPPKADLINMYLKCGDNDYHQLGHNLYTSLGNCSDSKGWYTALYRCDGTCTPPVDAAHTIAAPRDTCNVYDEDYVTGQTYSYMVKYWSDATTDGPASDVYTITPGPDLTGCVINPGGGDDGGGDDGGGDDGGGDDGGGTTADFTLTSNSGYVLAKVRGTSTGTDLSTGITITVSSQAGFNDIIAFSASGIPTGSNAMFSPSSVTTAGSSTFHVRIPDNTLPGQYTLSVNGRDTTTGVVQSISVTLDVSTAAGGQT